MSASDLLSQLQSLVPQDGRGSLSAADVAKAQDVLRKLKVRRTTLQTDAPFLTQMQKRLAHAIYLLFIRALCTA
jgi:hypothetical protein